MSGLRVDRLPAGDPALDAELGALLAEARGFAQQTPAWRDVITGQGDDEALYLGCRDGASLVGALPAYRFEGPLGAILVSCAQAGPLGGVVCHPDAERETVYAALCGAFLDLARERGCALATLFSDPLRPDRDLLERQLAPDFVLENVCQVLDLEQGLDAEGEPAAASSHVRRNLRKARAAGLAIDDEQSPENVAAWYAVHAARHTEIGTTPLPRRLFELALERAVPAGVARFHFVRRQDSGELVAGGLYLHHGDVVDALMPSMQSEAASLRPNYLLALHSMRCARAAGRRYYNWQGSPPGGGVQRFKLQWGSRDVEYAYLTRICGPADAFLGATPAEIRDGYPWHYALPFDQLGDAGGRSGPSRRESAWTSIEETQP